MKNLKIFIKKMYCVIMLMLATIVAFLALTKIGFELRGIPVYAICLMAIIISWCGIMQKE